MTKQKFTTCILYFLFAIYSQRQRDTNAKKLKHDVSYTIHIM